MVKHNHPKMLAVAVCSLLCVDAYGAGFQLNAQSATGLGRAFAGDAAISDNASAIARNPASAAFFKQSQVSLGGSLIQSNVSYEDATYTQMGGKTDPIDDAKDLGKLSIVPNAYSVVRFNDTWSLGLGLYSNFGTGTEFDSTFPANELGGLTKIQSLNGQLSIAFRVNDMLSFGAGGDLIYGSGEIKKIFNNAPILDAETDGIGFGFHGGLLFELNDDHRWGLSYRYSPKLETKGTISKSKDLVTLETKQDESLFVPLPDLIEFSGFHQLTSQWAAHYSFQYITWSKFDKVEAKTFADKNIGTYDWKDTWHAAVGLTFSINNNWKLRAGYMYDQQAVDKKRVIAIPDSNRQWAAMGLSFEQQQHVVDLGFAYVMGEDVEVDEPSPVGTSSKGTTKANAILGAILYTFRF